MNLSIPLSILCEMAWGTQSIFLKMAMRDATLYAAILITLIINFLVLVFLIWQWKVKRGRYLEKS